MPATPNPSLFPPEVRAVLFGPYADLPTGPDNELRLESLVTNDRVEGFATRYTAIVPLLDTHGKVVFSVQNDLPKLVAFLIHCFGGVTSQSHRVGPPLTGHWEGESGTCEDRSTSVMVYTRQSQAVDELFRKLKAILRQVGVQEEVLNERTDVWLVGD